MASATISNSGGPGSTIQLAPETIRVRDAVIERCENQTLEQMNEFVKSLLANETDELKRLGVLAARVFILRQRIHNLGAEGQIVGEGLKITDDGVIDVLVVICEVHLIDTDEQMWDAKQRCDVGVTPRLLQHAIACVDKDNGDICG